MDKNNYRPVSILTLCDKIFETTIANQLTEYFNTIINSMCLQKGIWHMDHSLFNIFVKWKWGLDYDDFVGTVLMDLSKAFDCIPHGLLICKLRAYVVSERSCIFLSTYLSNSYQRVKINTNRSEWEPVKKGIPQGSKITLLSPLSFRDIKT